MNQRLSAGILARGNDVKDIDHGSATPELVSLPFAVQEVQLTPDGTRVLYLADDDYDRVIELYSVRVDGTDERPLKLHEALAPPHDTGRDVIAFKIAPGGPGRPVRVVYALGAENSNAFELWTVEPDDPTTSAPLLPKDRFAENPVGNFVVTPDGTHVVCNAKLKDSSYYELFSVRIGEPDSVVKLSEGKVQTSNANPIEYLLASPDSSRVAYVATRDGSHRGVYSARVGVGEEPRETLLNPEHPFHKSGSKRRHFAITSDSGRVVFYASGFDNRTNLVSVALDEPEPALISTLGDGNIQNFAVSEAPGCNNVLYNNGDVGTNPRLWLATAGGESVVRVRRTMGSGWYAFAPKGCAYAFIDDGILFSGTGTSLRGVGTGVEDFVFHPDGGHIIFRSDQRTPGLFELYTVPVGTNEAMPVHQAGLQVEGFKIVEDSAGRSHVLFTAMKAGEDLTRLFSAPALPDGGPEAQDLSGDGFEDGGGVISHSRHNDPRFRLDHIWLGDQDRVVFTAKRRIDNQIDRRINDEIELFSAPLSGGEGPILLNRGHAPVGDVEEIWSTIDQSEETDEHPNGRKWVVYRADAELADRPDLFAVPADRQTGPRRINQFVDRASKKGTSGPVRFSKDGSRAFFLGPSSNSAFLKLFMHTFATGETSQLSPPQNEVASDSGVIAFHVHPTEAKIIYLADHRVWTIEELYEVHFDDPNPPGTVRQLLPDGDYQGVTEDFVITPNGDAVVLRGDLRVKRQNELFRLELASEQLSRLSWHQREEARVLGFQLAPETQQVVFLADGNENDQEELYAVPLAGPSSALTPISGPLGRNGDVGNDFATTFDGRHAVFRADAKQDGDMELFSVRIDRAAPTRVSLHENLELYSRGVDDFVLNPSKLQDPEAIEVAFRADTTAAGADPALLVATVGLAGSAGQVSPSDAAHIDVNVESDYAFTDDGSALLFRCDAPKDKHFSLYKWSAGQEGELLMHPPLENSETVLSFAPSPNSYRVAYLFGPSPRRLFSTSLEDPPGGTSAPIRLSLASGEFQDVSETVPVSYLPDSSQVLFLHDRRKDDTWELFTAYERMTISPLADQFILPNETSAPIGFTVHDHETRPSSITVTATSDNEALLPNEGLLLTRDGAGWQLTITPAVDAQGGPVTITIRAEAEDNCDMVSETFEVCIGSATDEYRSWLAGFFDAEGINDPAVGGYLADPDRDGTPNLAEWGRGSDPSLADGHTHPLLVSRQGEELVLQLRRPKPFPKALRLSFESSEDLRSWSTRSASSEPTVVSDDGTSEVVEARFAIPGEEPREWFLRLRYATRSN